MYIWNVINTGLHSPLPMTRFTLLISLFKLSSYAMCQQINDVTNNYRWWSLFSSCIIPNGIPLHRIFCVSFYLFQLLFIELLIIYYLSISAIVVGRTCLIRIMFLSHHSSVIEWWFDYFYLFIFKIQCWYG